MLKLKTFLANKKYKYKNEKDYCILFFILLIISLIVFFPYIFGGRYYFFQGTDSVRTTFPAYYSGANYLENKWSWWSFHMGIGASQLSRSVVFSDPFNYVFLFNKDAIKELIIYAVILRILCAGMFFFHYLNNFNYSVYSKYLASIAYAFCGYIIVMGRNYGFATICVYLPLVLNGIEVALRKKKYSALIVSLSLVLIYFNVMFFIIVFVTVAYFMIRMFQYRKNNTVKIFFKYVLCFMLSGITSILLSSFWFLPLLYTTGQSPRIGAEMSMDLKFGINWHAVATAISRLLGIDVLGSDILKKDGTLIPYHGYATQYSQLTTYTSVLVIVILIMVLSSQNWKTKTKIFLGMACTIAIFASNYFSYIMNGFSTITYRWIFVFHAALAVFLMIGIEVLFSDRKIKFVQMAIFSMIALLVYFYSIYYCISKESSVLNNLWDFLDVNTKSTLIPVFIAGIYFATILLYQKKWIPEKIFRIFIMVMLISEIVFNYSNWSTMSISYGKDMGKDDIDYFDDSMKMISEIRNKDIGFYRMDKDFDSLYRDDGLPSDNDALVQNYFGLKNYSSLNPLGYTRFLQSLGIYVMCPLETVDKDVVKPEDITSASVNYINGVGDRYQLRAFLGVKYFLTKTADASQLPADYKLYKSYNGIDCYVTKQYNPLMFVTYYTISPEEFNKLSEIEKDTLLFSTSVLETDAKKYEKNVSATLKENSDIAKIINSNQNNFEMNEFQEDYIKAYITAEKDGILNATISFDKGWSIYIDGQKVDSFTVDNGLLGCEIRNGTHLIELRYFPYGMKIGIIISITTLVCLSVSKILLKSRKKRNREIISYV